MAARRHRIRHGHIVVGLALVSLAGCVSIAPPVRTGQYGAPGRMEAGMVEAGVSGNYWPDASGGAMLGYAASDLVAVEAGGEISGYRAIGYLGTRLTPLRPDGRDFAFVLDIEGGFGAGVGGQKCDADVCESRAQNFQRPAGGGYLGLGIGGKIKFFSPWLRVRTQATAAEGIPITSTTTALAGVQFSIARLVHIYAGTGGYLIANQALGTFGGWFAIDGGLSFTIPTARTRRMREQRSQARLAPRLRLGG